MPDNLTSLYEREEEIRRDSLAMIDGDSDLRAHLLMIHCSMCAVFALAHDHVHLSEDELTVQFLGLRLFNSAASALKLALAGYYQSAFGPVRDLFETTALMDYLQSFPQQIAVWRASAKKQRMKEFGPPAIRDALDKRDGFQCRKRQQTYERFSEYAAHPTAPGFKLLAPEGLGEIGPFLSQKYLRAWMKETVKLLVHGAVVFASHFPDVEPPVRLAEGGFLREADVWRKRYLGDNTPEQPA
jgi:hypothetical protein